MAEQDQYGFIMNPGSGPQKKSLLPTNLSKKQVIIFGAGAAVLLAILVTILFSVLNSGPSNKDHLIAVAAQQSEIIRISDTAVENARGQEARNMAQTMQLSLRSDQSTLSAVFKSNNVRFPKTAAKAANSKALTEAQQNNRFDQAYLELVQEELVEYQRRLNTAYQTSENTRLKEAMKIQYENASTLIGEDPEL